ncbi:MAG: Gfo/Idh/MocA family oxidoreductase [Treponema sp.]|jgi:predicted dehydrogenase|nr:Gfo/Idh/MocA family oxidoreductase [Treponema sp.]
MPKVRAALIGAGDRGTNAYAPYALQHPDDVCFVAVADPLQSRRERFAKLYGVPPERCYPNAEELWARPKIADGVIICTSDKEHYIPAKTALEKGYHVLLEKPLSTNPARCLSLKETAEKNGLTLMTCYVLRYTAFYQRLFGIVQSGRIGRLVSIQQHDNIGHAHFSHSYVRGNWRSAAASCPMILSKSCHDLDIFFWFAGSPCKSVQSFGRLHYFTRENAPKGAPDRCTDGCPAREDCVYYAPSIYAKENSGFASSIVADGGDYAARMEALKSGPYGKCVFKNDNDACDNQVVNMLFENGVTVSFSINGLSYECNRNIRLYGTQGELRGDLLRNTIELYNFKSGAVERIELHGRPDRQGGGDYGIIHDFVQVLNGRGQKLTAVENSLESHMMAFAAEESRKTGRVVDVKEYAAELRAKGNLDSE